jgi:hypothetical protein
MSMQVPSKSEYDPSYDDDDHGDERSVTEEPVGGGHAVVQNQDRHLGRHKSRVVEDGEGI